jgi:hypothetical protein
MAYPAMIDVPREPVRHLAQLLAAERRARGTRRGTRALTCFYQALLVLVWFRKAEDKTLLGAGFGVCRATAYRYVDEGVAVRCAQAPQLHDAPHRVADEGCSPVILDGKPFDRDRLTETTLSVNRETIDAWYPGKHRDFGANSQAVMRPDGPPIWTSGAMPGHLHDLTGAQQHGVTAALDRSAAELVCPSWPTPATTAQLTASKPRSSSPPTAVSSPSPTAASTGYYAARAGTANAASPFSTGAAKRYVTPPPAPAGSATSSPQPCT